MQDYRIRRAQEEDLPVLGRLGALLVKAHFAFDPKRFKSPVPGLEEGYAWFLGRQMKEPGAVVFVAQGEDAILGYVYAEMEPESWKELRDEAGFIHDVVVDPAYQHGGIGGALLEAASDWLREQGAPRVVLFTAEQNTGAQRLFARLGFRRTMIEMTREFPGKG